MDARDIERLSELLQFERNMLEARIEMEGMIAENKQREIEGKSMAYDRSDFMIIIDDHHIGYNDFPYYKG